MKEFTETLLRTICFRPDELTARVQFGLTSVNIEVSCHPDDFGSLIGKGGARHRAITTILSKHSGLNGKFLRYTVKDPPTKPSNLKRKKPKAQPIGPTLEVLGMVLAATCPEAVITKIDDSAHRLSVTIDGFSTVELAEAIDDVFFAVGRAKGKTMEISFTQSDEKEITK